MAPFSRWPISRSIRFPQRKRAPLSLLTTLLALPMDTWASLYLQIFLGLLVLLLAHSVQLSAQNLPLLVYAGLFGAAVAAGIRSYALRILCAENEKIAVFKNRPPIDYRLARGADAGRGVILLSRYRGWTDLPWHHRVLGQGTSGGHPRSWLTQALRRLSGAPRVRVVASAEFSLRQERPA